MRRLRSLFLALATSFVAAAPAHAAVTPVDLGVGTKPSVVVDPAGTSHILFLPDTFGAPQYCRLPRGATACDIRTALTENVDLLFGFFVHVLILDFGLLCRPD